MSNFTNKALEWELADQQLSRLLITPNFTKSDGTRAEPVRFLDTTSSGLTSYVIKENEIVEHCVFGDIGNDEERRTWAVFLAALVASCLRGALPVEKTDLVSTAKFTVERD